LVNINSNKAKYSRGMYKMIIIAFVIYFVMADIFGIVISNAASIDSANLYSKGECGELLKKDGSTVRTSFIVYNNNGTEYPAYCLDKPKPGVGESGSYTVSVDSVLNNVLVWRAIINGYPYKTPTQLGCANANEAFMATKMAVYSVLYGYKIEEFSGIGEAGARTLSALNNIINAAYSSNESKISSDLTITEDNNWDQDSINSRYISKTFKVTSKASSGNYTIDISSNTDSYLLTDMNNNRKSEFAPGEKFKILLPISELGNGGNINITAKSLVNTKPVFIGKAPNSTLQDYAITGLTYEDGVGSKNIDYYKNETKIKILKQDTNTRVPLQGAKFDLLDENKNIIHTNLISNENGEIILNDIMPGIYYLKETKAPGEYNLYEDYILLDIKFYEEITVIVNNSEKEKTTVETSKNKLEVSPKASGQTKLPKTGM